MKWEEQGTVDNERYSVVPRTLSFLTHNGQVLLLRGAPSKRIWANKLNGIGGHLEPGDGARPGARREILEETRLTVEELRLCAVVHISGVPPDPGVIMFVFVGSASTRQVDSFSEGELTWYPIGQWPEHEMVDDLPHLLPRILHIPSGGMVYGHYALDPVGQRMIFHFS